MSDPSASCDVVLVTGAAGVIGRSLVHQLLDASHQVVGADIRPRPSWWPPAASYLEGDLRDVGYDWLRKINPTTIYHLAATFERTVESREFGMDNFDNNVRLSHNLLMAALLLPNLRRYVFASSYLVYDPGLYLGQTAVRELSEGDPLRPRNLIGAAKAFHESELAHAKNVGFAANVSVARIFRGYGLGSRDVISRWVRDTLRGKPAEVFGELDTFDYVFASDSASGLMASATLPGEFEVVNIAGGASNSIGDVRSLILDKLPSAKFSKSYSPGTGEKSLGNISRLSNLSGWQPRIDLASGIDLIIQHESREVGGGEPH